MEGKKQIINLQNVIYINNKITVVIYAKFLHIRPIRRDVNNVLVIWLSGHFIHRPDMLGSCSFQEGWFIKYPLLSKNWKVLWPREIFIFDVQILFYLSLRFLLGLKSHVHRSTVNRVISVFVFVNYCVDN